MMVLYDERHCEKRSRRRATARRRRRFNTAPHEHERALKGAYRSFVIPDAFKTDIDSYFDRTKSHIKTLIENQLKEMWPAKIIMTLWVILEEAYRIPY